MADGWGTQKATSKQGDREKGKCLFIGDFFTRRTIQWRELYTMETEIGEASESNNSGSQVSFFTRNATMVSFHNGKVNERFICKPYICG